MVSFGTATLVSPMKRKVNRGRTFDCGKYGHLSANEIAKLTKLSREGVWQRVRKGFTKEELVAPKHESLRKVKDRCSKPVVSIAVKLARAYPDKVPTLKQIQQTHPMTPRNAMRWRQAFADAEKRA